MTMNEYLFVLLLFRKKRVKSKHRPTFISFLFVILSYAYWCVQTNAALEKKVADNRKMSNRKPYLHIHSSCGTQRVLTEREKNANAFVSAI